jgi:LAO/AO transport system kinase
MTFELAEADFEAWATRLRAGERRTLARLLTYAESTRAEHGRALSRFFEFADAPAKAAVRVGVTGIPGAGKSSLIDALGSHWVGRGLSVAVLAVDPSSVLSGGSVLGDKVRMAQLGASDRAFIRPVPSGGALGGVSVHLDDCARLCELAGYERIVIETVGVGQSEVDVSLICDVLTVVAVPGTGDELQAVKRGITEFADVLLLNKCDTVSAPALQALIAMYEEGLTLVQGRPASVFGCSAHAGVGVERWAQEIDLKARSPHVGRRDKRAILFRRVFEHAVLRRVWEKATTSPVLREITEQLRLERLTLRVAVERLLDAVSPD